MSHNRQNKVAVINDFCGFGRCSLAVSLPIISAMKLQCCSLPTSIFSNHTGYDSFFCSDYTEYMNAYIDEWLKLDLRFDGILTGFLRSPEQIEIVKRFLEIFKTKENFIVIDPVMGDNGKLYPTYSPILAERMKSLITYADILTPNLTEACILAGIEYRADIDEKQLYSLCEKISELGPKKIVVSGLERGDDLENYIYEAEKPPAVIREHKVGICRAGTGDVFSSMIVADAVKGKSLVDSVCHASSFIAKALRRTVELNIPQPDGICFEEFLSEI